MDNNMNLLDASQLGAGDITGKVIVEDTNVKRLEDFEPVEYVDELDAPFPEHLIDPPGLVGDMVKSIRAYSRRDQPVLAVSGAFSALAMVSNNVYCVIPDNTPLAPYAINVTMTGGGKESIRSWIKAVAYKLGVMDRVRESMSSSTAILRKLTDNPTLLLMQDEFGRQLQQANGKDNAHAMTSVTEIMSLFGTSLDVYSGRSFADTKSAIEPIKNPFVTLMGSTTNTELMTALKGADVDSGFLNRCVLFESASKMPSKKVANMNIPADLIVRLKRVMTGMIKQQVHTIGTAQFVPVSVSKDAKFIFDSFSDIADRGMEIQPYGSMWARAHQHALIYAGLLAVGDGLVIKKDHANYAVDLVEYSVTRWIAKMSQESSESKFGSERKKILKIIRKASKYRHDKRYGEYCARGLMPRSKLTNMTPHLTQLELDRVIDSLMQGEEIAENTVSGSGNKPVHIYHAL